MQRQILILILVLLLNGCGLIVFDGTISKDELVNNSEFKWFKDSTDHFIIYYENNSWASKHLDLIKTEAEKSLQHCLTLVQKDNYQNSISYFIVEDRKRMNDLIYRKTNGQAFPAINVVCAIASDSVKALGSHEIFHVISHTYLGSTKGWVSEGMAVYSDNAWWKQDLYALSNYFRFKNKLIPIKELITRFRSFDDRISYPESGSLLKYLYENYGFNNIKILWSQGIEAFCTSTGKSLETIEKEWQATIFHVDTSKVRYIF